MAADEEEITLSDLFGILWDGKRLIAATTLFFALVGVLTTWLTAPLYEAKSVILFPGSGISSMAGLAQSLGLTVSADTSSLKMYAMVIESDRMRRRVSRLTGVTPTALKRSVNIVDDLESRSITITVRHSNRSLAQLIAKTYLSELASLSKELSIPVARNRVTFLERELSLRTRELADAETKLMRFQQQLVGEGRALSISRLSSAASPLTAGVSSDIVSIMSQIGAIQLQLVQVREQIRASLEKAQRLAGVSPMLPINIPTVTPWREKLMDIDYQLKVAELTYGPDAPSVIRLNRERHIIWEKMREEIVAYLRSVNMGFEPSLASLELQRVSLEAQLAALQRFANRAPSDMLVLQRLERDTIVLAEIVKQLRVALEQARMEVARDPERWEVLEEGAIQNTPVNKNWLKNLGLGAVGGLFLGVMLHIATVRRLQS